jgi:hypothetical protein
MNARDSLKGRNAAAAREFILQASQAREQTMSGRDIYGEHASPLMPARLDYAVRGGADLTSTGCRRSMP